MKKLWLLVSFALVLVLGACGGDGEGGEDESEQPADEGVTTEEGGDEGDGADSSDTALAEQTYEQNNCMGCHGQDLSGGSGPPLANVGNQLSEDEIRTKIQEGGGGMPAGLVTDEEKLDALVTWLASQKSE